MTVRNGTATLPPPATAAARASAATQPPDLVHLCAAHSDQITLEAELACARGDGCISYCGIDLTQHRYVGDSPDLGEPDACVVCTDLWRQA